MDSQNRTEFKQIVPIETRTVYRTGISPRVLVFRVLPTPSVHTVSLPFVENIAERR